jgi:hypothetical protein
MWLELPERGEKRVERLAKIPKLTTAASSGEVDAQVALGWEYARGDIVDFDIITAWKWFERAAASGKEDAVAHYARFLQLRCVPNGVRQLRKLAATGNWKAQFWLAQQYSWQPGRLNQLRAAVWFGRSYKNGNTIGKFAQLAQLRKLVPSRLKVIFLFAIFFEFLTTVRSLMNNIELYEQLLFRLKRRTD